jgi:hypothetical protein
MSLCLPACCCQLRDERGIAEDLDSKMLGLKRTELAGVLSGKPRPQPLAALLFT